MKRTKETDDFARESIPILKELNYLQEKESNSVNWGFVTLIVLFALAIGIFYYGGKNDWYKDDIQLNVQPPIVNNTYNNEFNPNTEVNNQYEFRPSHNITIINNITNST